MKNYNDVGRRDSLKKDRAKQWLYGVCAGIALFYQLPRLLVRLLVFGLFLMFPLFTVFSYTMAAFVLPNIRGHVNSKRARR